MYIGCIFLQFETCIKHYADETKDLQFETCIKHYADETKDIQFETSIKHYADETKDLRNRIFHARFKQQQQQEMYACIGTYHWQKKVKHNFQYDNKSLNDTEYINL